MNVDTISRTEAEILIASHLNDGRLVEPPSCDVASRLEVINPATGDVIGAIPNMGGRETQAAIERAEAAQPGWAALGPYRRADVLQSWADLMVENRADLAIIVTLEQGKPLREAEEEVDYALSFLRWFAEEGKRHYGEVIPSHKDGARLLTLRQPIGVTAAITPWNWPLAMITRKAGAALAAGCPMIVRPASETPFSAIALMRLAVRAGLPRDVFPLVLGDPEEIARVLMESRTVRALSFTGSTLVGKVLLAQSASTVKRMALELGGHAPFIVCADADLDAAVEGAMQTKFEAAGQSCTALNKAFVHESLYAEFCERIAARAGALKAGNGLEPDTDVGPLMSAAAIRTCQAHVDDAVAKGAELVVGGHALSGPGHFFAPTVLKGVTPDMLVSREETFGPVLPVSPFADPDQAVALANDTDYGLAAFVYGENLKTIWRLMERLDYGMIGVNTFSMTGPPVPFGGTKQSGLGREGSYQGLEEFTEVKYACLGAMGAEA
ncbi:MAG: NAD-dependent succinate-semialdehyde dehydrogenase [Sphingomonadales bacterium]|nr:NAD-dependent succinate-semialdehyde dehydrogenase [Sphingomonadales bacterium]